MGNHHAVTAVLRCCVTLPSGPLVDLVREWQLVRQQASCPAVGQATSSPLHPRILLRNRHWLRMEWWQRPHPKLHLFLRAPMVRCWAWRCLYLILSEPVLQFSWPSVALVLARAVLEWQQATLGLARAEVLFLAPQALSTLLLVRGNNAPRFTI